MMTFSGSNRRRLDGNGKQTTGLNSNENDSKIQEEYIYIEGSH